MSNLSQSIEISPQMCYTCITEHLKKVKFFTHKEGDWGSQSYPNFILLFFTLSAEGGGVRQMIPISLFLLLFYFDVFPKSLLEMQSYGTNIEIIAFFQVIKCIEHS